MNHLAYDATVAAGIDNLSCSITFNFLYTSFVQ